jgi:hypothetical protein
LEGNKEISHRSWYRRIRISRIGTQEGVAEEMSDIKELKKIKETFEGMQSVAYDAMERLTFSGSAKSEKKSTDK